MPSVDSNLEYCRQLARQQQYALYLISLFTPENTRHAWWALLAFQAELSKTRQMVTNPLAGQIRLQWWRDTIAQCIEGKAPAHPVAIQLAQAIQQFKLPKAPFDILVDAREDDFGDPPADENCLNNYARATTVPLLQLLMACEGLDAATQARCFPMLDEMGVAWGKLQALKIWPDAILNQHYLKIGNPKKVLFGSPSLRLADDKRTYLNLLPILITAEYKKLSRVNNIKKAQNGYGLLTILKLWLIS